MLKNLLQKLSETWDFFWNGMSEKDLGYHKITCSVYNVMRQPCNCGAGDEVDP